METLIVSSRGSVDSGYRESGNLPDSGNACTCSPGRTVHRRVHGAAIKGVDNVTISKRWG